MEPGVVRRRVLQIRLRERLRRRDVQPVAERRVDAERHLRMQPVVDHGGHERPLARHLRLAFDHRRDREHVVRREVLAPRVREIQPAPLRVELAELIADELSRGRLAVEVVRVGEEEALERQLLGPEAGERARLRGRRRVGRPRELHLPVRLLLGDLRHRLCPRDHLRARESLGEDDAELPQLADRGRRRRSAARSAAAARGSRRDQHGADPYERAAHHSR